MTMMMQIDYTVDQLSAKAANLALHDPTWGVTMDDAFSVEDVEMEDVSDDDHVESLPYDRMDVDLSDDDDDDSLMDMDVEDDMMDVDVSNDDPANAQYHAFSLQSLYASLPQTSIFQTTKPASSSSISFSQPPTSILRSSHKTRASWANSSATAPLQRRVWFSQRSSSSLTFDTTMPPELLTL